MLVKKELLGIDILPIPEIPKDEKRSFYSSANASIVKLPKSGDILVVDFFRNNDKSLKMRFFSDGKNYVTCREWPTAVWHQANPRGDMGWCSYCYSDPALDSIAESIIGKRYKWAEGLLTLVDDFISEVNWTTRSKRNTAQAELKKRHFDMYPQLPADLIEYCDNHMFSGGYIFFSQKNKEGKRKARCGVCGYEFEPEYHVSHNQHGRCPSCGRVSIYKAKWIRRECKDKGRICIAERRGEDILLRWTEAVRTFEWPDFKEKYYFFDFCYNLHIHKCAGQKDAFRLENHSGTPKKGCGGG